MKVKMKYFNRIHFNYPHFKNMQLKTEKICFLNRTKYAACYKKLKFLSILLIFQMIPSPEKADQIFIHDITKAREMILKHGAAVYVLKDISKSSSQQIIM